MIPAEHSVSLVRLTSPDVHAASEWLRAVLGWSIEPAEHIEPGVYCARNGQGVVALLGNRPPQRTDGAHWDHFIGVPNVAVTLQRAAVLGWRTVIQPVQMGRLGTMALLHGPSGVPLWLWQGRVLFGFSGASGPGGVSGFEVRSASPEVTLEGLSSLLGWKREGHRLTIPGSSPAWVRGLPGENFSGHWLTAAGVSDLPAAVSAAVSAGGRLVEPAAAHPTLGTCALVTSEAAGPLLLSQI
jgi:hypothetical protein